jgi:hypothetical protein
LPHVEFAYNRTVHSTTQLCPFEVVYGFKPITPLDMLPLLIQERVNMKASKRADFVRKIHEKIREAIEKKGTYNADRVNKKRNEELFQPGDMVWVHFRKDRFPEWCKSKLLPRGDGPYKVLTKINDNAYKIDLPLDVSVILSMLLIWHHMMEITLERHGRHLLRGGGEDEGILTSLPSSIDDIAGRVDVQHKPNDLCIGPITIACAKLLEQYVNLLLTEYNLFINENFILPNSLYDCMIRFATKGSMVRGGEELHEDNHKMVPIISESMRRKGKQEHHH